MTMNTTKQNKFTKKDFNKMFPDTDTCVEWLKNHLYPDGIFCPVCNKITYHHRIHNHPVYACDDCRHQISPLANTIFEHSSTPLKTWFEAIYEMSTTRTGYSAKALQRSTGVTYKTAWRMFKQIRSMLGENITHSGEVELDETYVGGKAINMHASKRAMLTGRGTADKTAVFGIVERHGKVTAKVILGTDKQTLIPIIKNKVANGTTVYTDEMSAYDPLAENGFSHKVVNHSDKVYVKGSAHTNTIEGFWSLVKRGIAGVYHNVSPKYLQSYVNEYSFRYNHRKDETPMFQNFLNQI
jgi:transposase-like protein